MPPVREVTVLAAGGTIAMSGDGGATPALDAAGLIAAVPALAGVPGLQARTLGGWPGVHVSAADALEIARAAAAEAAGGRGVVITHGTDTLEETAVLCDLLHGGDAPIVLTGAIRPASAVGADGPANLLDAVRAAGDAATAGLGVLVAFAGELHAAQAVRKSDSVSPRAFSSPRSGPLGRISEQSVEIWSAPTRRPPLPVAQLDARVEIIAAGLGSRRRARRGGTRRRRGRSRRGAAGRRARAARRSSPPAAPRRGAFPSSPACGRSRGASCARPTASRAPSATSARPG